MEAQAVELNEGKLAILTSFFGDKTDPVMLDEETTRAIYSYAWAELERHLVDANATYNDETGDLFDRASNLRDSLQSAHRFADVIYALTAVPETEAEETS